MKKIALVLTGLLVTACASGPSAYGPVDADSRDGFRSTQLEQDRFRVSFRGNEPLEVQDYALLRAAEITLDEGYSHFKILDGYMTDNAGRRSPFSTSVGVGFGGRGYRHGGTRTHIGIGVDDVVKAIDGDSYTSIIEVRLLHSGSQDPSVYDAASVAGSVKPLVFK